MTDPARQPHAQGLGHIHAEVIFARTVYIVARIPVTVERGLDTQVRGRPEPPVVLQAEQQALILRRRTGLVECLLE